MFKQLCHMMVYPTVVWWGAATSSKMRMQAPCDSNNVQAHARCTRAGPCSRTWICICSLVLVFGHMHAHAFTNTRQQVSSTLPSAYMDPAQLHRQSPGGRLASEGKPLRTWCHNINQLCCQGSSGADRDSLMICLLPLQTYDWAWQPVIQTAAAHHCGNVHTARARNRPLSLTLARRARHRT